MQPKVISNFALQCLNVVSCINMKWSMLPVA